MRCLRKHRPQKQQSTRWPGNPRKHLFHKGNEAHWPNLVRRKPSYEQHSSDLFSRVCCSHVNGFCFRSAASEGGRECSFALLVSFCPNAGFRHYGPASERTESDP